MEIPSSLPLSSGRTSGGGGDDVLRGGPGPAQVLVREVQDDLVVGVRVDGCHEAADDAEALHHDLGHRRDAVRGAGGVRDDVVRGGVVLAVVDAHHDRDVLAAGRRGDDDLPGAPVQVLARVGGLGEPAGRLDHHVHAQVAPGQRGGVTLGQHPDRVRAGRDDAVAGLDRQVQRAQQGVVFQQVRACGQVAQVVRGDDLHARAGPGLHGPPEVPADPAKSVDAHPHGHGCVLLFMSVIRYEPTRRRAAPLARLRTYRKHRPARAAGQSRGQVRA